MPSPGLSRLPLPRCGLSIFFFLGCERVHEWLMPRFCVLPCLDPRNMFPVWVAPAPYPAPGAPNRSMSEHMCRSEPAILRGKTLMSYRRQYTQGSMIQLPSSRCHYWRLKVPTDFFLPMATEMPLILGSPAANLENAIGI